MTVYLDCNATTPVDPRVITRMTSFLAEEFGNAGSRTHEFGARAKKAVDAARAQVAAVVGARQDEVILTSGATESNNIAILGLAEHGLKTDKRHIVTTAIEHKAVLEPVNELRRRGFEVTVVPPTSGGFVDVGEISSALRDDTILVSVMHVNNETGVIQPIDEIAHSMETHEAYLHVDAAQSFGKIFDTLRHWRIDMISISGHKIYGPKGIGALITRRRKYSRPPLAPLFFGGGQERGLRPGTQPVHQIVGLGAAAELAIKEHEQRAQRCRDFQAGVKAELAPLSPVYIGDQEKTLFTTASVRFPGIDSEAVIIALKGIAAVSNGSACTSASYSPSHVLLAMGLTEKETEEVVRISWSHETDQPTWQGFRDRVRSLL